LCRTLVAPLALPVASSPIAPPAAALLVFTFSGLALRRP